MKTLINKSGSNFNDESSYQNEKEESIDETDY